MGERKEVFSLSRGTFTIERSKETELIKRDATRRGKTIFALSTEKKSHCPSLHHPQGTMHILERNRQRTGKKNRAPKEERKRWSEKKLR